jgi:hypothetical protein
MGRTLASATRGGPPIGADLATASAPNTASRIRHRAATLQGNFASISKGAGDAIGSVQESGRLLSKAADMSTPREPFGVEKLD